MNAEQAIELRLAMTSLLEVFQKIMDSDKEAKMTMYVSGLKVYIGHPYWWINFAKWTENRLEEKNVPENCRLGQWGEDYITV